MAVTVIDPAAGELSKAIANLGDAASRKIFSKRIREREIAGNLELMKGMAAGFRAAKEVGQEDIFLEAIGVRAEFGKGLLAFQADEEELGEIARVQAGVPSLEAAALAGEAGVSALVSEQVLESGIVPLQAENALKTARLEGRTLTAQELSDIPELSTEVAIGDLTRQQAENLAATDLLRRQEIAGVNRLTVDAQVLQARAQMADANLSIQSINSLKSYIDALDLNDPEQAKVHDEIIFGLTDPTYLQLLAQREARDINANLRQAAAIQTSQEQMFSDTLQLEQRVADAVEVLNEAQGDAVEPAKVRLNNLRLLASKLEIEGRLFPMDLTGAGGKTGKFEFFFEGVESENVGMWLGILGDFIKDGQSPEDALKEAREAMELAGLTQREKEEFEEKAPLVVDIQLQLLAPDTSQVGSQAAGVANRFTTTPELQLLISRAGMQ